MKVKYGDIIQINGKIRCLFIGKQGNEIKIFNIIKKKYEVLELDLVRSAEKIEINRNEIWVLYESIPGEKFSVLTMLLDDYIKMYGKQKRINSVFRAKNKVSACDYKIHYLKKKI